METKLFNQDWKEIWMIELNDSVFNVEVNKWLIHRALVYQLAQARINVAHTKTRGQRRGSTRKIYRQKGTWRARMGANRSPVRKKGWVVFGPSNQVNFSIKMNKKERRTALHSLLSMKIAENNLLVVDSLNYDSIKTKNMVSFLNNINFEKNVLLVLNGKNEIIEKSSNNLPNIKTIQVNYLNFSDLLKYKTLVLLKDSLETVNSFSK